MYQQLTDPTLSIVTINYNSGGGLVKTVDSILEFLGQLNIELILVDGLSSDDSLSRLGSKRDLFSLVISEKDLGIYDAMNKGIKYAKGDWIWFLNSGDVALESSKEILQYLVSEKEKYNFLYCNFSTDLGRVVDQNLTLKQLFRGMINHQTIFYRRDLIDSFDLSFGLGADFAHLLRLYSEIKHQKIDISVVRYDLNGKSSAFDRFTRVKTWYQRFRAFRDSSLRFDYRIYGMVFSLTVCLAKAFFPKFGSKTIKLK
ncbi:glycosyltransferase [Polynucleobacter sp. MG-5-Ahmo-C2]|uniref:glycosyltransferase n=1 Tax=Polynucleobacter sp. MG-5-Ahmo-C2 TaxID=2081051 RepID=UPI001BFE8CFC|nr:glycosyltransferase [Polynucleobacter sp. MG-5-Ahmo-C2]QWD98826.1 glycosyltransferase [Polynucleobacter sp. MG-5-Ahmo-C2]